MSMVVRVYGLWPCIVENTKKTSLFLIIWSLLYSCLFTGNHSPDTLFFNGKDIICFDNDRKRVNMPMNYDGEVNIQLSAYRITTEIETRKKNLKVDIKQLQIVEREIECVFK